MTPALFGNSRVHSRKISPRFFLSAASLETSLRISVRKGRGPPDGSMVPSIFPSAERRVFGAHRTVAPIGAHPGLPIRPSDRSLESVATRAATRRSPGSIHCYWRGGSVRCELLWELSLPPLNADRWRCSLAIGLAFYLGGGRHLLPTGPHGS